MARRILFLLLAAALTLGLVPGSYGQVHAQSDCSTYQATGKTVCGKFLEYWNTHGGLAQQGYPISDQMQEISDTDGKTYTVQYFERAVFELHPENPPPNDVLLSLLGTFPIQAEIPGGAPNQKASTANAIHLPADRQDRRRQVPRILGATRRAGPAGLSHLRRVPGEERPGRQDLHRPVFRASRVRVSPGEPGSLRRAPVPARHFPLQSQIRRGSASCPLPPRQITIGRPLPPGCKATCRRL